MFVIIHWRLEQACNHIAGLLFYIEHHSICDELPYDLSKTSKAMTWNQPSKKEIKPARAEDIVFYSNVNEVKVVQSMQGILISLIHVILHTEY